MLRDIYSLTDYFSRYAYVFLIASDKSNVLDVFKIYKIEIEHQLEKTTKIIRSNRDGEYEKFNMGTSS